MDIFLPGVWQNPLFIYLLSELGATLLWFIPVGEKHQQNNIRLIAKGRNQNTSRMLKNI